MRRFILILLPIFIIAAGLIFFGQQFFSAHEAALESQLQANLLTSSLNLQLKTSHALNILFVGDIMLDRGVEYQIGKNQDFKFPFFKIADYLNSFDYVIGNLEGPIVESPKKYPKDSLVFNFDPRVLEGFQFANINILSLANNHSINVGRNGLEQTKKFLADSNINYFGDPIDCDIKDIYKNNQFILIGINKTFPQNCSNGKIAETIEAVKNKWPENLIFVFVHWGEEYQNQASTSQQKLAHLLIDAGTDLIVGSHPHVVQNSELYKDKWVYYSLGNFIFDQNFSKETMEGLVLKVAIKGKKLENIEPVNIKIIQTFQPETNEL